MRLNKIFKGVLVSGGLFTKMNELYSLPFSDLIKDFKALDFDFITKFGNRETSVLLDTILAGDYILVKRGNDYVIDSRDDRVFINQPFTYDQMLEVLSTIIYQRYATQWARLYETMKVTYNPIHNYDMKETSTDKLSSSDSSKSSTNTDEKVSTNSNQKSSTNTDEKVATNSNQKSSTNTNTKQSTNKDEKTATALDHIDNTQNFNAGFNSTEAKPTTNSSITINYDPAKNYSQITANKDNNYVELTGDKSNNYVQIEGNENDNYVHTTGDKSNNYVQIEGSETDNYVHTTGNKDNNYVENEGSREQENEHTLERAGNIGVTTTQKMLEDERKLWLYDFINVMFVQVADMISCKIYFR